MTEEASAGATRRLGPLRVGGVAHGGWCVARHDGLAVFIAGTLPGELVTVEVTAQRSKLWFAEVVDVVEASPDRVPHVWPLAERTGVGGADLGHVALKAQRRWKAEVVAQQLARLAGLEWPVEVIPAPGDDARGGLGWRTRLELTADADGRLGMRPPRSHRLVPLDSMPLAHEDIVAAAPWCDPVTPGARRRVVRASGTPGLVVVDTSPPADGLSRGRRSGATTPRSAVRGQPMATPEGRGQRVQRSATRPGPPVTPGGDENAAPSPPVTEEVLWRDHRFTCQLDATGFWQVHRAAPGVLVEAVTAALGDPAGQTVLDLYAGVGLFSLPLAGARRLVAVEGDARAAHWAAHNLPGDSATVVHDDVRRALVAPPRVVPGRVDSVILDPPRVGAGRPVVEAVAAHRPTTVVYVACDPAALARDVALFGQHGYRLTDLAAFDLYPHTHHVEAVATLRR